MQPVLPATDLRPLAGESTKLKERKSYLGGQKMNTVKWIALTAVAALTLLSLSGCVVIGC